MAKSLILTTMGLKPGVELSQENVQEAVRALVNLNVFEDIQLYAEEDESTGDVRLIVVVEEYPAMEGSALQGPQEDERKRDEGGPESRTRPADSTQRHRPRPAEDPGPLQRQGVFTGLRWSASCSRLKTRG